MPARLDWRIGPAGQQPAGIDPLWEAEHAERPIGHDPRAEAGRPAPRRRARWPVFALAYLLILGTAALVGFGLGRWSELYGSTRSRIENQLAIESLAWRDADAGLLASTLDPAAPDAWRREQIEDFPGLAPLPFRGRIRSIELVRPGLARVVVAVEFPAGDEDQTRYYRWAKGTWYRTPGPGDP